MEQRSRNEALGDINWGEAARKTPQLPMAFTPTSVSSPSTTTATLIANNDSLQTEIDPITWAVAQAQGQLCLAMEAKWAEDLWQWVEKGWEDQIRRTRW